MKKSLYMLFAVSLFLPAPASKAEAQIPLPPPNALQVIPGDFCEGCILNVCNCVINSPIIIQM
ncbi:hypothetical protein Strain138_001070 [Pseudogemmatithrix spongiicola]|uniref:Uncharacterized protein n=1 Tax=Pseudogemmatithrix spongiicola TaxID=3062599 RepID=A0AA49Q7I0_9BACT|nr:hypothetical protein Strain138_001070 [Gemmatimonadaceae bacterium 'strain 138']WKW14714.1 hypothetical protein Strain318_001070 [Gemmatimonadaceae bacterium 'strain 318']